MFPFNSDHSKVRYIILLFQITMKLSLFLFLFGYATAARLLQCRQLYYLQQSNVHSVMTKVVQITRMVFISAFMQLNPFIVAYVGTLFHEKTILFLKSFSFFGRLCNSAFVFPSKRAFVYHSMFIQDAPKDM